jgi:hypothetical protein
MRCYSDLELLSLEYYVDGRVKSTEFSPATRRPQVQRMSLVLREENVRKYIGLILEQVQQSKPEKSAEEKAVGLAIEAVEGKVRRWEETLEKGLLSLEECADRIKELRREREELLSRKVHLQKTADVKTKIIPIPTRLMNVYIRELQVRLRAKKIGYKKEFLRNP